MAWTSPITWTAGQLVSTANLNTHIRDNLIALGAHGHDAGVGGEGSGSLAGLAKTTFADAVAPSAPGAGLTVLYTTAGRLRFRAGAGGADTLLDDPSHTH